MSFVTDSSSAEAENREVIIGIVAIIDLLNYITTTEDIDKVETNCKPPGAN